ncbi:MAG: Fe-S-containing protein [Lachnospiraceae bacterium]|nr:Fe-S-containing protein [Lachnospiraceae bacterium]
MLSYLILTTEALMIAVIVLGVVSGYTKAKALKFQKNIILISALLGIILSIIISILRNTTSSIDSAILNGWIYAITLVSFILLIIFLIADKISKNKNKIISTIIFCLLGISLIMVISYAFPDVWAYPYHVAQFERSILSTDFLMSMIGMTLGLVLVIVMYFAVSVTEKKLNDIWAYLFLITELTVNAAIKASGLISVLFQKRIIKSNHTLFVYTVFIKNHSREIIFFAMAIATIFAIIMIIRSFDKTIPYKNPADHRIIKAKQRSMRRFAAAIIICSIIGVINLSYFVKLNETEVTLSPIEPAASVDDENIYVTFEQVSDGHLHRFAYTTENGVEIRFIVIKKPNSSSYGIGLDACDVCGETGYYERDGQVVCNLCDVVMNISTIGFKGGCNPIVIPYSIENGQIVVPISGLLEYESEFK